MAIDAVAGTVRVVDGKVMVTYLSTVIVVSTSDRTEAICTSVLLS